MEPILIPAEDNTANNNIFLALHEGENVSPKPLMVERPAAGSYHIVQPLIQQPNSPSCGSEPISVAMINGNHNSRQNTSDPALQKNEKTVHTPREESPVSVQLTAETMVVDNVSSLTRTNNQDKNDDDGDEDSNKEEANKQYDYFALPMSRRELVKRRERFLVFARIVVRLLDHRKEHHESQLLRHILWNCAQGHLHNEQQIQQGNEQAHEEQLEKLKKIRLIINRGTVMRTGTCLIT